MNVIAHASIPIARMNNEYAKVFLNNAIKYAIGVANLLGVKAVSTVRRNKKIPMYLGSAANLVNSSS